MIQTIASMLVPTLTALAVTIFTGEYFPQSGGDTANLPYAEAVRVTE